jgi:hypothetical protein
LLKNLKVLYLNNNTGLSTLPKAIWTGLKMLKTFSIDGTPWLENPANKPKYDELKRRGILLV